MKQNLFEYHSPDNFTSEILESVDTLGQKQKHLYLKGICLESEVRNFNNRVYPLHEIKRAVETLSEQIKKGSICGELNHPADLQINLERAAIQISEIYMNGTQGHAKLKVLSTPMGQIVKSLIGDGIKLGVSSRGSGEVDPYSGKVSNFEILTIDVVSTPSAPNAHPAPVYESLLNANNGYKALQVATEAQRDPQLQKYLKESLTGFIKDLKK
jgi:hypothetical protein